MIDKIVTMITDKATLAVFLGVLALSWIFYPQKKYNLPPGPTCWPIVGSTIALFRSKHGLRVFQQFFDWGQKYGSVIRVKWPIIGDVIIVNEINEAIEALVTKSSETSGRLYFHSLKVLTDNGKDIIFKDYCERIKYQRKIAGTALRNLLSGGRLETLVHHSVEKGIEVFQEKARSKEAIDPKQILSLLVYNFVCDMCFNKNFELEDEEFQAIYNANVEATNIFSGGMLVDVFPPARYMPNTKAFNRMLALLDIVSKHLVGEIQKHKAAFDPDNLKDFIDHMLKVEMDAENEEKTDKKVVLDELNNKQTVNDIFLAGVETTSGTLLFVLFLLTEFPEVQRKVQEEIDQVVGQARHPGTADRQCMPYCEAVLYESMRFGTLVPLGGPHRVMADTTVGGYDVPKHTTLIINHYALHRDPKEWKNPDKFDPNNFLDEEGNLLPKPRSFLPFGAGKRVCVGEAIVKPEMFMIFTALFKKFSFRFEEGHKHELTFQNVPLQCSPHPFKVIIEER